MFWKLVSQLFALTEGLATSWHASVQQKKRRVEQEGCSILDWLRYRCRITSSVRFAWWISTHYIAQLTWLKFSPSSNLTRNKQIESRDKREKPISFLLVAALPFNRPRVMTEKKTLLHSAEVWWVQLERVHILLRLSKKEFNSKLRVPNSILVRFRVSSHESLSKTFEHRHSFGCQHASTFWQVYLSNGPLTWNLSR